MRVIRSVVTMVRSVVIFTLSLAVMLVAIPFLCLGGIALVVIALIGVITSRYYGL